jgi:hypothetical protein
MRTLQTIIVTGIGKKYTRNAESKNLLSVLQKLNIFRRFILFYVIFI